MEVIDDYIAKLTNDGVINPHMTDDVSLDSVLDYRKIKEIYKHTIMRRFYTYSSKFIAINVFGFIPAVISYNTESHELAIFWILLIMLIVTVIHLFVYAVACMVTENSMERIDSVYRDKKNITTPLQALKSHIGSTYQISRKGGRSKHKIVTASKNQEPGISSQRSGEIECKVQRSQESILPTSISFYMCPALDACG